MSTKNRSQIYGFLIQNIFFRTLHKFLYLLSTRFPTTELFEKEKNSDWEAIDLRTVFGGHIFRWTYIWDWALIWDWTYIWE
jgi:hypothetical protein